MLRPAPFYFSCSLQHRKGTDQRKRSIKALRGGAYLILDIPKEGLAERGLIRQEGLFKTLDEKDIYDSFITLLPHICGIKMQFYESNT